MNLVFASDSIWNWEAEKNYALLKEQNPELVQAAQRGNSVVGTGGVGADMEGYVFSFSFPCPHLSKTSRCLFFMANKTLIDSMRGNWLIF